jgi:acetyl-CoA C-acetyltransferase
VHPVDLGAHVLEGLVGHSGIDPGIVDDVLFGSLDGLSRRC